MLYIVDFQHFTQIIKSKIQVTAQVLPWIYAKYTGTVEMFDTNYLL